MLRYILLLAVCVIAIQARSPLIDKCSNKPLCMMLCKYGNHVDQDGCAICKCKQPPHCLNVMCAMYCEHGFRVGADGCQTCKCKQPPHCQPVRCKMFCDHGFKVGADGCEICQCNKPPRAG
ncbi:antistasin-like isoform X2 [Mytilus californianus]|uniref:antistasin-like isoform X1 n=1 Tax=Mytilus californianus TaxID=6549 RepID=UPI002246066E|nr:antistasin-like isoform X1 [Mytilus californianus]XP_052084764.1 antistasin-like isoform X2 [Mytilus californianus]